MPEVTWSNPLAFIAIVVSVLTFAWSRIAERRVETRQQTFELRVYSLTMLDPARGTLQRIIIDINRIMNSEKAQAGGIEFSDADETSVALAKLDREAVDTFNAIRHHLPRDEWQVMDAARTALEERWIVQNSFKPGRDARAHGENADGGRRSSTSDPRG